MRQNWWEFLVVPGHTSIQIASQRLRDREPDFEIAMPETDEISVAIEATASPNKIFEKKYFRTAPRAFLASNRTPRSDISILEILFRLTRLPSNRNGTFTKREFTSTGENRANKKNAKYINRP
ncbi:hypothetical protein [Maricaulis maris]|uniref:hypothetical protein n=1 Tax=Maricaulis maris TaxID=74318 RepID=UPI00291FE9D5|nr:hypothetical protein MACH15_05300 [Maricaulis maris]